MSCLQASKLMMLRDGSMSWRAVISAGREQLGRLTEAHAHSVGSISVDNNPPRFNSAINTAGVKQEA